jgi:hypothetical protein
MAERLEPSVMRVQVAKAESESDIAHNEDRAEQQDDLWPSRRPFRGKRANHKRQSADCNNAKANNVGVEMHSGAHHLTSIRPQKSAFKGR